MDGSIGGITNGLDYSDGDASDLSLLINGDLQGEQPLISPPPMSSTDPESHLIYENFTFFPYNLSETKCNPIQVINCDDYIFKSQSIEPSPSSPTASTVTPVTTTSGQTSASPYHSAATSMGPIAPANDLSPSTHVVTISSSTVPNLQRQQQQQQQPLQQPSHYYQQANDYQAWNQVSYHNAWSYCPQYCQVHGMQIYPYYNPYLRYTRSGQVYVPPNLYPANYDPGRSKSNQVTPVKRRRKDFTPYGNKGI